MRSSQFLLLAGCIGVAGCATQAERQAESMDTILQNAQQAEQSCLAEVKTDPVVNNVLTYLVIDEDDPNKLVKLSDNRYVDTNISDSLIYAQQRVGPCRSLAKSAYGEAHPALAEVASATFAAQDRILLALINGQATFGEANQALLEVDRLSHQAWNETTGMIQQQLASAHAQEMQQRQAAALALQQYSLQQQLINNMNRPTTTHCNAFGNTLNCNTF